MQKYENPKKSSDSCPVSGEWVKLLTLSWRRIYHIETSPLICSANQLTGFYMTETSVMKELPPRSLCLPQMNIYKNKKNLGLYWFRDLRHERVNFNSSSLCLFQMNIYSNQKIFGGLNDTTWELLGKNKLDATLLHPHPK